MLMLILASAAFAGIHLFISGTKARDALVAKLGEKGFAAVFSIASAAVLGWMIWAYVRARAPEVTPLYDLRWLAVGLMFVSIVFVMLGLTTPGPTGVGGGGQLASEQPARGIGRVTRHPFLWGVTLWGVVHLIYNPGLPYLVFFGTFVIVALAGTLSIDAKRARRYGDLWPRYAAVTSNVPFGAITGGRNTLVPGEIGLWRIVVAIVAFLAVLMLHGQLFGLPAW